MPNRFESSEPFCSDTPTLAAARQLWSSGRADEALQAFDEVVEQQPNNIRALVDFAIVMGTSYQVEFAEELLDQAAALTVKLPDTVGFVADAYQKVFRPHRAIELLELHHSRQFLTPQWMAHLAVLYEREGQLDQARDHIEACLAVSKDVAEARLVHARIQRRCGNHREARRDLEMLAKDGPPLLRVRSLVELANVYDAECEFTLAIKAIQQARSLQQSWPGTQQLLEKNSRITTVLDDLSKRLRRTDVEAWQRAQNGMSPTRRDTAFMLGFPRSGTTLLHRFVAAHPELVVSAERSIFTDQILPAMKSGGDLSYCQLAAVSEETVAQLRNLFHQCHQSVLGRPLAGRTLIDKNPSLTSLLPWLMRLEPHASLIVSLRDPRDTILSNYLRYFPLNEYSASMLSLEGTAHQYVSDLQVWLRLREELPVNWVEIRYESLVEDHKSEVERVWKACGVAHDTTVEPTPGAQRESLNSPSASEAIKPIYHDSIGRWRHYEEWMEPVVGILKPVMDQLGY